MGQPKAYGTKSVRLSSDSSRALAMITVPSLGFVNAQCRFVMNPLGDYTVHFADPDMCVTQNSLSIGLMSIWLHVVSSNGRTYYR
jgi:hypothetical protein